MGNKQSFPRLSLKDRVIVVTGANQGLGYEIAKWCSILGATIVLACRSKEKAGNAIEKIENEFEDMKARDNELVFCSKLLLEFMKLDLASMQSVLDFCYDWRKSGRPLHVLVCNAGLGFVPFKKTDDGFESILQVNYLGHFLMIAKLRTVMRRSGDDCRIILMSSSMSNFATFDMSTINFSGPPEDFPASQYYCRSKLYQIMQSYSMARRFRGSNITINSVHPGGVDTDIWNKMGGSPFKSKLLALFLRATGRMRSIHEGAIGTIDLAVNPKHAGVSGYYWEDCKIEKTVFKLSDNVEKQEELHKTTIGLLHAILTNEEEFWLQYGIDAD